MKKSKLVLFVILLLLIFILSGCAETVTKTESTVNTNKAILLLPDGTVIKGTCTDYRRASDNWLVATVDGISYKLNDWRIVFIEEIATEVQENGN